MGLDDDIAAAERKLREGDGWGDLVRLATLKDRAGNPQLSRALGLRAPVEYENRAKAVAFGLAVEWVMERSGRSMNFGDFTLHLAVLDILGSPNPRRIGLRLVIEYRDSPDKIEFMVRRATEELTRREIEEAQSPGPRDPYGRIPRFA